MKRVAIVQRIFPEYRREFFESLNKKCESIVYHSQGRKQGTYVNSEFLNVGLNKAIISISVMLRLKSKEVYFTFSPFLIFELIRYQPDVILSEGATNLPNNILIYIYSKIFKVPVIWWDVGRDLTYKPSP